MIVILRESPEDPELAAWPNRNGLVTPPVAVASVCATVVITWFTSCAREGTDVSGRSE